MLELSAPAIYEQPVFLPMRLLLLTIACLWCAVVHASFPAPDFARYPTRIPVEDRDKKELRAQIVSLQRLTQDQPENFDAWLTLGACLESDSKFPKAIEAFRRAVALRPEREEALNSLGVVLLRVRSFEEALALLSKVVVLQPGHHYGWNNLAIALRLTNRLDEADVAARKAITIDETRPSSWSTLGYVKGQQKDNKAALEAFDRALTLDKDSVIARMGRAWILSEMGQLREARQLLADGIQAKPQASMLHAAMAILYLQESSTEQALKEAQLAVRLDPDGAIGWVALGGVHAQLRQWELAIPALEKARSLGAEGTFALTLLVEAYKAANQPDKAAAAIEKALSEDPGNLLIQLCAADLRLKQGQLAESAEGFYKVLRKDKSSKVAWVGLSEVFLAQSKPADAIHADRKALEIDPSMRSAWVNLAIAYWQNKETSATAAAANKCLELAPNVQQAWMLLALGEEDAEKSQSAAQKALELGAKEPWAHYAMGRALLRGRKGDEAIAALQAATSLSPNIAEFQYWLATAHLDAGQYENAAIAVRHAIDADPSGIDSWKLLGDIQQKAGKHDDAVTAFKRAICLEPFDGSAHLALAQAYLEVATKDESSALSKDLLRELERAVHFQPTLRLAWEHLYRCYAKLGRSGDAANAARQIVGLGGELPAGLDDPKIREAGELLKGAHAKGKDGYHASERRLLLEAQDLAPSDMPLLAQVVGTLISTGYTQAAVDLATREVERSGGCAGAYGALGKAMFAANRFNEALIAYGNAAQRLPEEVRYWKGIGWSALSLKQGDEAAEGFLKALKLFPEDQDCATGLFRALLIKADPIAAERTFKQLTQDFPEAAPGWFGLGAVECKAGMKTVGLQHMMRAVKLRPGYGMAWMEIGDELMNFTDSRSSAVTAYERSLKGRPSDAPTLTALGHAHLLLGRNELAIRALSIALMVAPKYAAALPDLIRAEWRVGDQGEARKACEQLRKLDPKAADLVQAELKL